MLQTEEETEDGAADDDEESGHSHVTPKRLRQQLQSGREGESPLQSAHSPSAATESGLCCVLQQSLMSDADPSGCLASKSTQFLPPLNTSQTLRSHSRRQRDPCKRAGRCAGPHAQGVCRVLHGLYLV